MKLVFLAATLVLFATAGCKPSTPDSPDPASYGKVITPDHHVPAEHQDTQENHEQSVARARNPGRATGMKKS